MSYLEAPRHVVATSALLNDWHGPVIFEGGPAVLLGPDNIDGRYLVSRSDGWEVMNDTTWCRSVEPGELELDPMRAEVQDRLFRVIPKLLMPGWSRLRDWQRSAREYQSWLTVPLLACAAAGIIPRRVASAWYSETPRDADDEEDAGSDSSVRVRSPYRVNPADGLDLHGAFPSARVHNGGWNISEFGAHPHPTVWGSATGDAGRACADAALIEHRFALEMVADESVLLPWPDLSGEVKPMLWRRVP